MSLRGRSVARGYNYTPILNLPLHWNPGGNVEGDLHNRLAEALEDILITQLGGTWKAPVASAAFLPMIGNAPGDVRVTLDTSQMWVWNNIGVVWVPVGSGVYAGHFEQPTVPNTIQIPDGWWGFWWNTTTSELRQVRNRGGTMYGVELTAFP